MAGENFAEPRRDRALDRVGPEDQEAWLRKNGGPSRDIDWGEDRERVEALRKLGYSVAKAQYASPWKGARRGQFARVMIIDGIALTRRDFERKADNAIARINGEKIDA